MNKKSWKKHLLFIGSVTLLIAAAVFVVLLFTARTYSVYMQDSKDGYENIFTEYSDPGIVEMTSSEFKDGVWEVRFRALKPGSTVITVHFLHRDHEHFKDLTDSYGDTLYVTHVGTILETASLDFNGISVLCCGLALLFTCIGTYLLLQYRQRKKDCFFSYNTVLYLGIGCFFLLLGALFVCLEIFLAGHPQDSSGQLLFFVLQYAMSALVIVSFPFMLLLAFKMTVSNIWLVRHEGLRKTNLLGFVLAILIIGGIGVSTLLAALNSQWLTFEPRTIMISSVRTLISSLYLYFAANLIATQYCCIIAARRKPPMDQDYILILGCAIRKDGTLYPLLKGRADRAISFYRAQLEATGTAPLLVPSGGQGSDEVIAEGEAVRRYLLSCGIPEGDILPETESTNTLENMKFSKQIIDQRGESAKVIFSTTNYHVFRSGIQAESVGLHADGIASKTKWYFWPNAQIREFIGLLVKTWKLHMILGSALALLSLLLSNIGAWVDGMIS